MPMIRTWPTGSTRRGRAARDSGTTSAVSTMAAIPTGMFTQKMPRHPVVATSTPPSTGPSAMLRPNTAPHTPSALARSRSSVNVFAMMDKATGLSIDPPMACTARNAISQPRPGARLHSRGADGEGGQARLERAPPADPVPGGARQYQETRDHQRVGVHRPLQAGHRGVQVVLDRRQRDVQHGDVKADDEQARAADGKHQQPAPAAEFRHAFLAMW